MILLHLMGGLGNQMSQVAFAYFVARENNDCVKVETTSYKYYKRRPCSINKFQLSKNITFDNKKNFHFCKSRMNQIIYHIFVKLFFDGKESGEKLFRIYERFGHLYSFDSKYYILNDIKGKKDIYGYFLIEPYFRKYYVEICEMFDVKKEFMSEKAKNYQEKIKKVDIPIAVSLRLQDDYLNDKTMYVCTRNYYLKGIDILKKQFPKATFFVFADDIHKAREMELLNEAIYISETTDVEGIQLMKQCKHFLISNSSFSWWGAYLATNNDKLIIAPDHWINNNKDYSNKYYEGVKKIGC